MGGRRLSRRLPRELIELLRGRRRLVRVTGTSMSPTLQPGDVVGVDTTVDGLPEPGEVVLVRDPARPERTLVKRARSRGDASFAVGSDDPLEARDSRHFGSLRLDHLLGRATWAWSTERGFRAL